MNPYTRLGSAIGTDEAIALSARLAAWHDAMVQHERRLGTGRSADTCDDECPHADARILWAEAVALLGPRASELAFLRSRALEASRRTAWSAASGSVSETAGRSASSRPGTPAPSPGASAAAAGL